MMVTKRLFLFVSIWVCRMECVGQTPNAGVPSPPSSPPAAIQHASLARASRSQVAQRQPRKQTKSAPNLNPAVVWPGFEVPAGQNSGRAITCSLVNNTHPEISPNMHQGDSLTFTISGPTGGVIAVTQTYNGVPTYYVTPWTIPPNGVFEYLALQASLTGSYIQEWLVDDVPCDNNPIQFEVYPVVAPVPTTTKDYIYFNGKVAAIENHN